MPEDVSENNRTYFLTSDEEVGELHEPEVFRSTLEEGEDLPVLEKDDIIVKAALRLYYFDKEASEYSSLGDIDLRVCQAIISRLPEDNAIEELVLDLQEESFLRQAEITGDDPDEQEELPQPVYFAEWKQDEETFQRYLTTFQNSPATGCFYQWVEEHARPPKGKEDVTISRPITRQSSLTDLVYPKLPYTQQTDKVSYPKLDVITGETPSHSSRITKLQIDSGKLAQIEKAKTRRQSIEQREERRRDREERVERAG